jgi:hypothetical protein
MARSVTLTVPVYIGSQDLVFFLCDIVCRSNQSRQLPHVRSNTTYFTSRRLLPYLIFKKHVCFSRSSLLHNQTSVLFIRQTNSSHFAAVLMVQKCDWLAFDDARI